MAQIDISGKVLHPPGPWGLARPAVGVGVELIDVDIGNANDSLWAGTTDHLGAFSGRSADWRDTRSVTTGAGPATVTTQVADPTDAMLLKLRLSQRIGTRWQSIELPYVPPPPGLPPPPLLVNWGPAGRGGLSFNGTPVHTMEMFARLIGDTFAAGAGVGIGVARHEICVFADDLSALRSAFAELEAEMRAIGAALQALGGQQLATELAGAGARLQQTADNIRANVNAAGARAGTIPTVVFGKPPAAGMNPLERGAGTPIDLGARVPGGRPLPTMQVSPEGLRQRVLAFLASLEPAFRRAAATADTVTGSRIATIGAAIVAAIVASVVAVVQSAVLVSAAAGPAALLLAAVVSALVVAVVTVLQNIPALLRAAGFGDAAREMETWSDQNQWWGGMLTAIVVVCALICLAVSAPGAAWAWVVDQVTGAGGAQGMRFVFSR